MFKKLRTILDWIETTWKKYGFEILLLLVVVIIVIVAIFRIGKKGTWSERVLIASSAKKTRKTPQESKGEVECRRSLQSIFQKPFPKARPNILRNPVTSENGNDNNLELDCYNPELKLACEYQGVQHYKFIPYFHKNRDAFQNQKYRDHLKKEMCQKNGIVLIEVPYTVKVPDIYNYISKKLDEVGFKK